MQPMQLLHHIDVFCANLPNILYMLALGVKWAMYEHLIILLSNVIPHIVAKYVRSRIIHCCTWNLHLLALLLPQLVPKKSETTVFP